MPAPSRGSRMDTEHALYTVRAKPGLVGGSQESALCGGREEQPAVVACPAGWTALAAVGTGNTTREQGHGRDETRSLKVVGCHELNLPHARQAVKVTLSFPRFAGRVWCVPGETLAVPGVTSRERIVVPSAEIEDGPDQASSDAISLTSLAV